MLIKECGRRDPAAIFLGRAKYVENRVHVNIFQAISPIGTYELNMVVFDNDYQEGIFHNFGFKNENSVSDIAIDEAANIIGGPIGNVVKSSKNISKKLIKAHEKSIYLKFL